MSDLQTQLPTNTWIYTSWEEYEQIVANLLNEKGKSYYYKGHMRLEMPPVSFDRGKDHVVIIFAVTLFATITALPAAMRYILKTESDDRRGARRKVYCIIAGSAVKGF
ncbi:hypothetical protein [Nostoc sp.]|uniref:hypothetical protein n=1 Tax=Nostoc sp. TaxID=1180 RepID=UPI002FFCD4DB